MVGKAENSCGFADKACCGNLGLDYFEGGALLWLMTVCGWVAYGVAHGLVLDPPFFITHSQTLMTMMAVAIILGGIFNSQAFSERDGTL